MYVWLKQILIWAYCSSACWDIKWKSIERNGIVNESSEFVHFVEIEKYHQASKQASRGWEDNYRQGQGKAIHSLINTLTWLGKHTHTHTTWINRVCFLLGIILIRNSLFYMSVCLVLVTLSSVTIVFTLIGVVAFVDFWINLLFLLLLYVK